MIVEKKKIGKIGREKRTVDFHGQELFVKYINDLARSVRLLSIRFMNQRALQG